MDVPHDPTETLQGMEDGDTPTGETPSTDELVLLVQKELHRQAVHSLKAERRNHTLQPTALVNEVYIRLTDRHRISWKNKAHFLAVAAREMRRIVVDFARNRNAQKRGGPVDRVTIDDSLLASSPTEDLDVLALDEALTRLSELDER